MTSRKAERRRREQIRKVRSRKITFEGLEDRRLLANAALSGGNLQITDAAGANDVLTVSSDGTTLTLAANSPITATGMTGSGTNTVTLPLSSVTGSLNVDLGGGNDSLTFGGTVIAKGGTHGVGRDDCGERECHAQHAGRHR